MGMANYMRVTPPASPVIIRTILQVLPEPSSVEVHLSGNLDYSSISKQVGEILPGVEIYKGHDFYLKDPEKETIFDIFLPSSGSANAERHSVRGIQLIKATWYIPDLMAYDLRHPSSAHIELTPYELSISYNSPMPDYVSKLVQKIRRGKVALKFELSS
ncbi:MAG: hypothetical protein HYW26_05250 [Candidatus Aenigmarchaeota archaeon]|nr:hypothetical protein [Candidatus Aenigmarchaeota archaeon]